MLASALDHYARQQQITVKALKAARGARWGSLTRLVAVVVALPALAGAIIVLGQSLDIETVAEGIETELQFRRLRELGCEYGQGFLLADRHGIHLPDMDHAIGRIIMAIRCDLPA